MVGKNKSREGRKIKAAKMTRREEPAMRKDLDCSILEIHGPTRRTNELNREVTGDWDVFTLPEAISLNFPGGT